MRVIVRRRRVRAVGQDRRPRRRRRRPRPGARARARRARRAGRRLPAALPLGAGPGDRPLAALAAGRPRPGAARGGTLAVVVRIVRRRRLPAPPGRPSRRPSTATASTATRAATSPTTRGASRCWPRAALEARRAEGATGRRPRDPRLARLPGRHPARPRLRRATRSSARRPPSLTIHNLAYHGWTPRDRVAQLGLGGDPPVGDAWGIDLLREGIRRAELVNTVSPDVRPRGAPARGRDGPRRRPARPRATASSGSSTASTRSSGTRRPTARSRRRTTPPTARARPPAGRTCCARVGFDPADPAPILGVIGRLDPAEGLRPRRRRGAGARRRAGRGSSRSGSGDASLVAGMRAAGGRPAGPDRAGRALRPRPGAADLRRRRPVPHAVALRAVRPGPDDRDALRDAAGRPPDRRPGRHDRRPPRGPGERDRLPVRRGDAGRAAVRRASARSSVLRDPDRARWDGLVRRGMAVDWAWERASAPAYAAMFRRAMAARRAATRPARRVGPARAGRRAGRSGRAAGRDHDGLDREARSVRRDLEGLPGGLRGLAEQPADGVGAPGRRGAVRDSQSSVSWRKRHRADDVAVEARRGDGGAPVRRHAACARGSDRGAAPRRSGRCRGRPPRGRRDPRGRPGRRVAGPGRPRGGSPRGPASGGSRSG